METSVKINERIGEIEPAMRAIRRQIHSRPELGYAEFETSKLIIQALRAAGLNVIEGFGGTGVVGVLKQGQGEKILALRADMDALPIEEVNTFPHRSANPGCMHACGHDGHVAMLLGAAQYLACHGAFDGTIVFIFQPAEEHGAGAKAMIDDGLFDQFDADAVFSLHNWPGLSAGHFAVRRGPIMASTNKFTILLRGTSAHAALPHQGKDPLFAAVQLYNCLQGLITREKDPMAAAVMSITQLVAGGAQNVVCSEASIAGTLRTLAKETIDDFESRIKELASAVAGGLGCTAEMTFERNCPPTINSNAETDFALEVMRDVVGADHVNGDVPATMGGEDFAYMLEKKPGCYAFLGNGIGSRRDLPHGAGPCILHSASYDFNDEILKIGASYWIALAEKYLQGFPRES